MEANFCNDCLGLAMAFQRLLQEAQSCRFIPLLRDIAFRHFAFVIDRPPQVVPLAVDPGAGTSSRCQRQCRKPRFRNTRCRLISDANIGPNRFQQNRTVSWHRS